MTRDTTVLTFQHPEEIDDPLTSVLRDGARRLLAQAAVAEAEVFLTAMREERLADGRARMVRHGHGPERTIQTGIGPVPVRRVKLRDRGAETASTDAGKITFTSAILPKWARRTKSVDALLPVLYLRGISTGDFQEALAALLGKDARNLSPSVIGRLKDDWQGEYDRWQRRDLSARRYVYVWADGVYLQARMEDDAACMLVLLGATPEGRKELVGFHVGVRESAQSWRELLVDLKARGLAIAPEIAVGDGALGFWKALEEIFPRAKHQRCWVHKVANVLNKVPKSVQPAMKADLAEVRDAQGRASAEAAVAVFADKSGAKYRAASQRAHEGCALTQDGPVDGLQACHGGVKDLASAEGRKPLAHGHRRRQIHRRRRRNRDRRSPRRLIRTRHPNSTIAPHNIDHLTKAICKVATMPTVANAKQPRRIAIIHANLAPEWT